MSDNKKYYYIRLKDNFFDSDEIKLLESIPNVGYKYSNILLKMYLKSLKYEGRLMFNENIPYNAEMLSIVTGHSVGDVKDALEKFETFRLIEKFDTGEIYMLNIQSFIGKSSTEADRIKAYRKKISDEKNKGVQMYNKCTPEIEIEKEIEIEIEKELEQDTEKKKKQKAYQKVVGMFENNGFGSVGGIISTNINDELDDFVQDDNYEQASEVLCKAIEIAVNQGKNKPAYVWGITKNWYQKKLFTLSAIEAELKKNRFSGGYKQPEKKKLKNGGYGTR